MISRRGLLILWFGFFVLIACFISLFADDDGGSSPAAYLGSGIGSRALGIGAFTALADDGTAAYWNPAGLGQLKNFEFDSQVSLLSLNRSHNFISYDHNLNKYGVLSAMLVNYSAGNDLEARQSNTLSPDSLFSDSEDCFYLSWGKDFNNHWLFGMNLKVLLQNLYNQNAFGLGFDLGTLYKDPQGWSAGLMLQDVYSYLSWNLSGAVDHLPFVGRIGLAYPVVKNLEAAGDLENGISYLTTWKWGLGAEYTMEDHFFIRAGVRNLLPCFGLGLDFPFAGTRCCFDYSLGLDNIDQSLIHNLSLQVRFENWQGFTSNENPEALNTAPTNKNP